jgi:phosphatidylserine decarboxylase
VSPCDGKILYYGPVVDGRIEQVKGITYDLANFLGHPAPVTPVPGQPAKVTRKTAEGSMDLTLTDAYESSLKHHPGNRLYHCTIYLSPADCHVFHSPTDFTLNAGRHFPGKLMMNFFSSNRASIIEQAADIVLVPACRSLVKRECACRSMGSWFICY